MPCRHPEDKTVPKIVPTSLKHRRLRHSVPPIGRRASLYANLVNIVRGLRWLPGKQASNVRENGRHEVAALEKDKVKY
jgi:hypothetical protein